MTENADAGLNAPLRLSSADAVDALRNGLLMLALYLVGCFGLLALVLVFQSDSDFPVTWLKGAVALAALGLRGQVYAKDTTSSDSGDSGFSIDLGSVHYGITPLVVLFLAVVLAVKIGRRQESVVPSTGVAQAALRAVATAAVAAAGLAIVGKLATLSSTDLGEETAGTAGVVIAPILLFGLPILALAFAAGRLRGRSRELAAKTKGVTAWVRTAALHGLVSSVGLIAVGFVYLLISSRHEVRDTTGDLTNDDASGVVLFILMLPNLALAATGFFQGFSIGAGGSAGAFGGSTSVGLLTGDVPVQHYLWALVVLASAVVVGTRRALQHPGGPSELWQAGVSSLLFWGAAALVLPVSIGAGFGGGSIGYTPLTWIPLAFAWGVLMHVAGRRTAPWVQARYPGLAARVTPVLAEEPAAPITATTAAVAPPVSRRSLGIIGAIVAMLVLATVAYKVADAKLYGPTSAAQGFLDDLSAGRASAALDRMASRPDDLTLLTDAALPAGKRITDAHVGQVTSHGYTAQVSVTYKVNGTTRQDDISMVKSGKKDVLFHGWKVSSDLGRLEIGSGFDSSAQGISLNGIPVDLNDDHPAFPGVYAISTDSTLLSLSTTEIDMGFGDSQQAVSTTLSESAKQKATDVVVKHLEDCLAAAKTLETTCGFSSYVYGDSYENVRWTLVGTPDLELTYEDGSIRVSSNGSVEAKVTGVAVQKDFFGGPPTRTPINETATTYVSGTVTVNGSTATFSSS